MPVVPSFTLSIDRTSLSLSPLLLSGTSDGTVLGVTDWAEPALRPRLSYAPPSAWIHGDQLLNWSYQQTLLVFSVCPAATSESAARAAYLELTAAISQFRYTATDATNDAPARSWTCDPGTVDAIPRDSPDMRNSSPLWSVSIPCYPLPS